ncbi:MAG: L,D-transpeptidase [Deltaproteobacteria bacterium]|nr:L,D-transpeptidase [Deltaproteobacteria bacterium]
MRLGWTFGCLVVGVVVAVIVMGSRNACPASSEESRLAIYVHKSARELLLQDGERVLRSFPIVLGTDPKGGKLYRGDGRTPEGTYYIGEKRPNSRFRRFLGISYPNITDAERAVQDKLINDDQWADIFFANLNNTMPPANTSLGGRVGIHGFGGRPEMPIDWTEGCIAVPDGDIDYLYDTVPLGTPVIITN